MRLRHRRCCTLPSWGVSQGVSVLPSFIEQHPEPGWLVPLASHCSGFLRFQAGCSFLTYLSAGCWPLFLPARPRRCPTLNFFPQHFCSGYFCWRGSVPVKRIEVGSVAVIPKACIGHVSPFFDACPPHLNTDTPPGGTHSLTLVCMAVNYGWDNQNQPVQPPGNL